MDNRNTPKMGALKVFSIIGIILSVLITVFGFLGISNLDASVYNSETNNFDYNSIHGRDALFFLFLFNGAFFLTFSIVACVKAFKNYN